MIMRKYHEQRFVDKFNNVDKMKKLLKGQKGPKPTQEEVENWKHP